jgi:hypothetical protein
VATFGEEAKGKWQIGRRAKFRGETGEIVKLIEEKMSGRRGISSSNGKCQKFPKMGPSANGQGKKWRECCCKPKKELVIYHQSCLGMEEGMGWGMPFAQMPRGCAECKVMHKNMTFPKWNTVNE